MSSSSTDSTPLLSLDDVDTVIFDLGGVILSLDYTATTSCLGALFGFDATAAFTQAKQMNFFDEFERGEIGNEEFRKQLLKAFAREGEPTCREIDAAWNAMLGDIPSIHLEILQNLSKKKRVFLLSNTNDIHIQAVWDRYSEVHGERFGPFADLFEKAYYSHQMGARKPETRIYEAVVKAHNLDPSRTVFIDDNKSNVEGARQAGLLAHFHPSNDPLASVEWLKPFVPK